MPGACPLTVLEETANHQAALVLRHIGDVLAVQLDKAVIDVEAAGNCIEQVDFPAPLEPMIVTKSPWFRCRDSPESACLALTVPGLKVFDID